MMHEVVWERLTAEGKELVLRCLKSQQEGRDNLYALLAHASDYKLVPDTWIKLLEFPTPDDGVLRIDLRQTLVPAFQQLEKSTKSCQKEYKKEYRPRIRGGD